MQVLQKGARPVVFLKNKPIDLHHLSIFYFPLPDANAGTKDRNERLTKINEN